MTWLWHKKTSPNGFTLLVVVVICCCSEVSKCCFFFALSPLFLFTSFVVSCGSYKTVYVKDFRVFIETDSNDLRDTVETLTLSYNDEFGGEALTLVDDKEDANSYIRFISGLRATKDKLGLGQWITVTAHEGQDVIAGGGKSLERTVVHSMELDFDLENFTAKQNGKFDRSSGEWKHLYHLFCHEVGHGLQMEHDEHKQSVMYKSIPEKSRNNLDYDGYFNAARSFFLN